MTSKTEKSFFLQPSWGMIHKSTQKTCYETGAENCRNPIKNVPAVPTYKACIHSPAAVQEKIMKDNTKIQDVKIKAKQQKKI